MGVQTPLASTLLPCKTDRLPGSGVRDALGPAPAPEVIVCCSFALRLPVPPRPSPVAVCSERPSRGAPVTPGLVVARVVSSQTWGVAVAPEARGPLGPRHRWSLWTDGRWPHLTPRFLGGAAPWDPPFVGVVHGVRTLHPRAVCRSQPPPERVARLDSCVRTGAEGLSGGNWMVVNVSPGTPGKPLRPDASCVPSV